MSTSIEVERLALEVSEWLRQLGDTTASISDDVPTATLNVATPTQNPDIYDCWPDEGVSIKGKKRQFVDGCIQVNSHPQLFFTKTGVVLCQGVATGRTLLFLRKKAVACIEQVRTSEIATKLTHVQLKQLHSSLAKLVRRQGSSNATE